MVRSQMATLQLTAQMTTTPRNINTQPKHAKSTRINAPATQQDRITPTPTTTSNNNTNTVTNTVTNLNTLSSSLLLLVVGCCLLLVACCLLFVVCCLLFVVCCLLVVGCCLLVVGCWLLVVGCWLLVVGCWLLVVGCWLLVVGCLLLVAWLVGYSVGWLGGWAVGWLGGWVVGWLGGRGGWGGWGGCGGRVWLVWLGVVVCGRADSFSNRRLVLLQDQTRKTRQGDLYQGASHSGARSKVEVNKLDHLFLDVLVSSLLAPSSRVPARMLRLVLYFWYSRKECSTDSGVCFARENGANNTCRLLENTVAACVSTDLPTTAGRALRHCPSISLSIINWMPNFTTPPCSP